MATEKARFSPELFMKKFLFILPALFLLNIVFANNTFAVDNYSYTWDWDEHPSYYLCGGNSERNCSDYSYVIFEPTGSCNENAPAFYVSGLSAYNEVISACSKIIAPISNSTLFLTGGQSLASRYTGDINITLTNDIASCNCPTPEPPEPCESNDTAIVDVFRQSFWNIMTAMVGLIIPVLALFLIFRLVHGLIFGRGV